MDRNVFALIAGTVFLLFIINAVVQMQTAMVREAAGGVSTTYTEATWETAGLMHVFSHDNADSFGHFSDGQDLDNALRDTGSECTVDGEGHFKPSGPLEIGFWNSLEQVDMSMKSECVNPSGYVRSAPLRISNDDHPLYIGVEK